MPIKVLARANGQAEVSIDGPIGQDWYGDGTTAKQFRADLKALGDVTEILVRINSPGGEVFDGASIYNALKEHKARVKVQVDGLAASIASVIAMAGDEIQMGVGAMFMIHSPWTIAMGDAENMRSVAEMLDKVGVGMADAYEMRTKQPRSTVEEWMAGETWFTRAEAIDAGLSDATADTADQVADAATASMLLKRAASHQFRAFAMTRVSKPPQVTAVSATTTAAAAAIQEMSMTPEELAAQAAQLKAKTDAAVAAALAADTERRRTIRDAFTGFAADHRELMDACLEDATVTPAAASDKLLKAVAAKQPGPLAGGHSQITVDARDKFKTGAQNAILARLGREKPEAGNEFNGRSLVDLAEASLNIAGISTKGMTKDGIARKVLATHTSSDFPVLLGNTAGKVLRAAYEAYPQTWKAWCAKGSVSDFKIHPRIQLGSFSSLATIVEGGEYTYGTLGETYENAQALTKGKAIAFTRQMLVNDDLGGFNRRAMLMGDSAARTVNTDIYTYLTSASGLGPTSVDTGTFFNATAVTTAGGHANYTSSGTAMSVASLGVGRVAMQKQKDSALLTVLNLQPEILLTTVGKEDVARTLIASETDPASSNSRVPNIYKNRFTVVADPFIDTVYANSWYLMVGANSPAAAMEIVFLDGNEVPFIDDEIDFDTDALKFKVRLDYGTAIGDWRGAYRNVGA